MAASLACLLLQQLLLLMLITPWRLASAQPGASYLAPHNAARALVGVPPLIWDPSLAAYAQSVCNARRATNSCRSLQPSGGPYGENKFWGSAGKLWTPADAVASWVELRRFYNISTNACVPSSEPCGVYTQVVWRNTTSLGCGSSLCADNSTFTMCSYHPPGNVRGQAPF